MVKQLKAFNTKNAEVVILEYPGKPRYGVNVYRLEQRLDHLTNQKLAATFTTNHLGDALSAYQDAIQNLSHFL